MATSVDPTFEDIIKEVPREKLAKPLVMKNVDQPPEKLSPFYDKETQLICEHIAQLKACSMEDLQQVLGMTNSETVSVHGEESEQKLMVLRKWGESRSSTMCDLLAILWNKHSMRDAVRKICEHLTNTGIIETQLQYGKLYKGLSDGQIESLVPDIAKMKQGQLSDTPQKIVPTALETPRSVLHPSGLPVAFQNTFEPSQGNVVYKSQESSSNTSSEQRPSSSPQSQNTVWRSPVQETVPFQETVSLQDVSVHTYSPIGIQLMLQSVMDRMNEIQMNQQRTEEWKAKHEHRHQEHEQRHHEHDQRHRLLEDELSWLKDQLAKTEQELADVKEKNKSLLLQLHQKDEECERKIEKLRQELKSALANAMEEKMENQHLRAENRELLTKLSRTEADLQAERVLNRKLQERLLEETSRGRRNETVASKSASNCTRTHSAALHDQVGSLPGSACTSTGPASYAREPSSVTPRLTAPPQHVTSPQSHPSRIPLPNRTNSGLEMRLQRPIQVGPSHSPQPPPATLSTRKPQLANPGQRSTRRSSQSTPSVTGKAPRTSKE